MNDFQCFCAAGYTGRMCNEEINECASNPCRNGASCEDLVNRYKCHCSAEYEGSSCQYLLGSAPQVTAPPTISSSTTRRASPPTSGGAGQSTEAVVSVNKAGVGAVSSGGDQGGSAAQVELSQNQLILIVCLGSGIPMVLLFILVSILLYRRCRNRVEENHSEESQQNAANAMNNRIHNQVRHSKAEVYQYPTAEKLVNDMETHQPLPLSYKNSNSASQTANKVLHKEMIKDINTEKERQMQKNVTPSSVYNNSDSSAGSGGGNYNINTDHHQQQYIQQRAAQNSVYLHHDRNNSNISCMSQPQQQQQRNSVTDSLTSQRQSQHSRQHRNNNINSSSSPSNTSSRSNQPSNSYIPTVCSSVMSSPHSAASRHHMSSPVNHHQHQRSQPEHHDIHEVPDSYDSVVISR